MFDFVLSMRLNLVLNKKLWFDEKQISLIRMKNQQKVKELVNGADVVNVEQWAKM